MRVVLAKLPNGREFLSVPPSVALPFGIEGFCLAERTSRYVVPLRLITFYRNKSTTIFTEPL